MFLEKIFISSSLKKIAHYAQISFPGVQGADE